MKKIARIGLLLTLSLTLLISAACTSPATIQPNQPNQQQPAAQETFRMVEADGTVLELDKVPERVAVISYGAALILDALGIEIVGIGNTARALPDSLKNVAQVGAPRSPNIEMLASLNAELVVISSAFKPMLAESFAQHNIPAFFMDNQLYEDTFKIIELFGEAFGKTERATQLLADLRGREAKVMANIQGKEAPTVMVIFGTSDSFQMARPNSYPGNMLKKLNGKNVTDGLNLGNNMAPYVALSLEQAVELNPEVILRISHGNAEEVANIFKREFSTNPVWQSIDAVKNNRVYDLSEELFFAHPGLRVVDALEELASYLYQ